MKYAGFYCLGWSHTWVGISCSPRDDSFKTPFVEVGAGIEILRVSAAPQSLLWLFSLLFKLLKTYSNVFFTGCTEFEIMQSSHFCCAVEILLITLQCCDLLLCNRIDRFAYRHRHEAKQPKQNSHSIWTALFRLTLPCAYSIQKGNNKPSSVQEVIRYNFTV